MLKRIGKGNESTLLGDHAAEFLRRQAGAVVFQFDGKAIYLLHELVLILFIVKVVHVVIHSAMAENERAVSDVITIVVVDCRSHDAFVL